MKGWSVQAVVTGGSSEPRSRIVVPSPSSVGSQSLPIADNDSDSKAASFSISGTSHVATDGPAAASALAEMFGNDSKEDEDENDDGEGVWHFPDSTQLKYEQLDPSNPVHRKKLMSLRPKNSGVLDFHNGSEEALLCFVERNAVKGNPQSVLNAIDIFSYARHWMMHASHSKVPYIHKAIALARRKIQQRQRLLDPKQDQADGHSHDHHHDSDNDNHTDDNDTEIEHDDLLSIPLVCLEIGSYCGYSAVAIASQLGPDGRLYCVELHPKCAVWTSRMVAFAGLSDRVKVIQGAVDEEVLESLRDVVAEDHLRLSSLSSAAASSSSSSSSSSAATASSSSSLRHPLERPGIDLLFIDHEKTMYLKDLMLIESSRLLRKGSVVVADNVLSFGKPLTAYLAHVRVPELTAAQQLAHRTTKSTHPLTNPTSPTTTQITTQNTALSSPPKLPIGHSNASPKTISSMSTLSLHTSSPTSPARRCSYSSSDCYKCFVEYSRYELYEEEVHGSDPEIDGVEISVYGIGTLDKVTSR